MSHDQRSRILDYLEHHRAPDQYKTGQLIFSQGDPAEDFFYLKRGLAHVYTVMEDGAQRNIMIAQPGRFFAESNFFLRGRCRQSSAVTLRDTEVLRIDRDLYRSCAERYPAFRQILLEELSEDLSIMFNQLADSALLEADVKVARFLCRRLPADPLAAPDPICYTQDQIAAVLGLSRWSVNRALNLFKGNGWLWVRRGRVEVLAPGPLRAFAYEKSDHRDG